MHDLKQIIVKKLDFVKIKRAEFHADFKIVENSQTIQQTNFSTDTTVFTCFQSQRLKSASNSDLFTPILNFCIQLI